MILQKVSSVREFRCSSPDADLWESRPRKDFSSLGLGSEGLKRKGSGVSLSRRCRLCKGFGVRFSGFRSLVALELTLTYQTLLFCRFLLYTLIWNL